MDIAEMGKNFLEIDLREDINPPDMEDVVTVVAESLMHLDPERYFIELVEFGKDRVFNVYRDRQLFGKYAIGPGAPGGPRWNKGDSDPIEDLKLDQEWEIIWLMVWTDVARRFGRWEGREWGVTKKQKAARIGRESLKDTEPEEYIYRLVKAQEGREIYDNRKNSNTTWKAICKQIGWRYGTDKSAVKLLYYARQELEWLEKSDPDGWLDKVSEYRRKEKKIND